MIYLAIIAAAFLGCSTKSESNGPSINKDQLKGHWKVSAIVSKDASKTIDASILNITLSFRDSDMDASDSLIPEYGCEKNRNYSISRMTITLNETAICSGRIVNVISLDSENMNIKNTTGDTVIFEKITSLPTNEGPRVPDETEKPKVATIGKELKKVKSGELMVEELDENDLVKLDSEDFSNKALAFAYGDISRYTYTLSSYRDLETRCALSVKDLDTAEEKSFKFDVKSMKASLDESYYMNNVKITIELDSPVFDMLVCVKTGTTEINLDDIKDAIGSNIALN